MFRILELNNTASARPAEVGGGYVTREDALAAIKRHLERFAVSGHNPEGSYWWAREFGRTAKVLDCRTFDVEHMRAFDHDDHCLVVDRCMDELLGVL